MEKKTILMELKAGSIIRYQYGKGKPSYGIIYHPVDPEIRWYKDKCARKITDPSCYLDVITKTFLEENVERIHHMGSINDLFDMLEQSHKKKEAPYERNDYVFVIKKDGRYWTQQGSFGKYAKYYPTLARARQAVSYHRSLMVGASIFKMPIKEEEHVETLLSK